MALSVTIRCASCGTLNRIPAERLGQAGRCGSCGAPLKADGAGRPVDVTDGEFHDAVLGSPVPVLLEFWAPTCGHCVRMHPVMEELASELAGRVKVAKMDVSANPRTPFDYEVRGTPAFVLFKGGRAALRFVGAMPKHEIINRIQGHI